MTREITLEDLRFEAKNRYDPQIALLPSDGEPGGRRLSMTSSSARSYGFCGEISGAKIAMSTSFAALIVAAAVVATCAASAGP